MQTEIYLLLIAVLITCLITLLVIISKNQKKIIRLESQIDTERNKLHVPYLNLTVDPSSPTLCLVNEGDILANHITIEDIKTVVDIGFKKSLLIRFQPVEQLKPNESIPLIIEIFEKEHALPPTILSQMSGVLLASSFKAYVHCANMEGIRYCIELIKQGPTCKINRVAVVEENQ